jgi:RimJ/RimL family protein N-acetyltransferase
MSNMHIRPLDLNEHWNVIEYFHNADNLLLETMGVDRNKLIVKEKWRNLFTEEIAKDMRQRKLFYLGWEYNGTLIGHSNINNLSVGDCANIHLHIWQQNNRERGLGEWFFKHSVNFFFDAFDLKIIIAEPHAENPAPNKLLQKAGLMPVRRYLTTPGILNFEQFVNRYEITEPFE